MKHYRDEWINEWCEDSGWTEPMLVSTNFYWAFPPNAVMPEPIPVEILRLIKSEKGFTLEEKKWLGGAVCFSFLCAVLSTFWQCPLPLVMAFAFTALTVARLDIED